MDRDDRITNGELARRSGLPVRTLRFYSDRASIRAMSERRAADRASDGGGDRVASAAAAHGRDDDDAFHAWLAELLETFTDARAERYWQLLGIINGWPRRPATVPAFQWLCEALRAG